MADDADDAEACSVPLRGGKPAPEPNLLAEPASGVQRFGQFFSNMVLPNISAFMAWGLFTALFAPNGWLPNARLAELVSPLILILLPVLIGATGGRAVHGQLGAVAGAVATMGVVVESDIPMFLAAMIIGPAAALLLKWFDAAATARTGSNLRLLVNTVGGAVIGGGTAAFGLLLLAPAVRWLTDVAGRGVTFLVEHNLLPLSSVLIEPARVLFLNNALNHGVLAPLGVADAAATDGSSILFMLETNPGTGFGVLLAYLLFGPRTVRPTVPAAMVIQFVGGIAEVYFPYVLMKPRLVLAAITGAAAGIAVFAATGVGLVATPAPGSIFAFLATTPPGDYGGVILGVATATTVSFAVASVLLGFGRSDRTGTAGSGASPDFRSS